MHDDHDYGFYGKGLDGYVHYRQGMAEAERNAPHSGSSNPSCDSYKESGERYSKSNRSYRFSADTSATEPKTSFGTSLKKWLRHPCNIAWIISWAVFLIAVAMDNAYNTVTTMYAAFVFDIFVIITSIIEGIRFVSWLLF